MEINIKNKESEYAQFRQGLHMIPEIGYKEVNTKKFILEKIKTFKNYNNIIICEVMESGFWIDVYGLKKTTETVIRGIAFRSDMDALPLTEETNLPYKSKNSGVCHACGHDGHMTILTFFLEQVLLRLNDIPTNYVIRFLYQPAEEGLGGAKKMIEFGCLIGIEQIYGFHNLTMFNLGEIGLKAGAVMSEGTVFEVEIIGKGGHGALPELTLSPITIGSELISRFNEIPSQHTNSQERFDISIGYFNSGETDNVIPEKALIKGTVRSYNKYTQNPVIEEMKIIITGAEILNKGSKINLLYDVKSPITYNDEKLYKEIVLPSLINSEIKIIEKGLPVPMSEDFSFYQQSIRGVFILLGCGDDSHRESLHSPRYDYNDNATKIGIDIYIRILNYILNKQKDK